MCSNLLFLRARRQVSWGARAKFFSCRHAGVHATQNWAAPKVILAAVGLRGNFAGKTWAKRIMHRRQASWDARIVAGSPSACNGAELRAAQTHNGRVGMTGTDLAIILQ